MGCDSQFDNYNAQVNAVEHHYKFGKCSCGEKTASFGDWARHVALKTTGITTEVKGPSLPPEESRYARFHKLLRELESLHDSKGADYDGTGQEYGNHKAVQDWGIAAWKSPLLRIGEKMRRLQTFAQSGNINYDGVEDSLRDIAVLSLIALILFQEEH